MSTKRRRQSSFNADLPSQGGKVLAHTEKILERYSQTAVMSEELLQRYKNTAASSMEDLEKERENSRLMRNEFDLELQSTKRTYEIRIEELILNYEERMISMQKNCEARIREEVEEKVTEEL